jgi:aspartate aminotransferase
VIVGTGAKSVVYHGILALLDPEDVMIVPSPAWPSYAGMAALAGGRVVEARLDPRNGWTLRVEALLRAVAEARGRARVLIVNSPHNPTGALYPADEQARIAEVARGEDLWVISDEIYEHLSYEGPTTSMAALPHMRERTLTVNGVSKSFAMTGWRIGYAGGPAELIQAMAAFQGHTTGNASSISQHAAEAALRLMLEGDPELVAERRRIREAMMRRRDLACRELAALPGLQCVKPGGAFYVFADVSPWIGRELQGRFIAGSAELAAYLLEEAGVSVVAGAVFGDDRCLRLSFATSLEELSVGLQRIKRALA